MLADKSYKAIVFDWDGTLMDSTHHIVGAIQGACADLELAVPSAREASWVIGMSLQAALYKLVPELDTKNVDLFIKRYRYHFERLQHEICLFDGQLNLLHDLKSRGALLAVATGKSRRGLDVFINRLDLRHMFETTKTVDEARGKPDPDMLQQIMLELGLQADSILMVGDTTHDIFMAHAAGMDSLAVSYGAHARDLLVDSKPTALVDTVPDMQQWLKAHISSDLS